ncbi:MAG: FAD binding domain-containing protein [Actinomycetota bacterium]|nr:FAD binding domain-containing protein [Actinomycetota bacterium]
MSELALAPEWLAPSSLEEALERKAEYGEEATVVAGGTFLAILINQRLLAPSLLLALRDVPGLSYVETNGDLRLGAMTTHRAVELSSPVQSGWPALARAFSLVASPRVRNQATVGGVLADADYASDPPAMLAALGGRVVAKRRGGEREIPVEELITGYYETSLSPEELIVEARVPAGGRAVYRKFRSRSHEDRPCVSVAAAVRDGTLRVVVGAVAARPQHFPEICALADGGEVDGELATEIGERYAEEIDPLSDVRGSSSYRRRVIAVEIRRALEELERSRLANELASA